MKYTPDILQRQRTAYIGLISSNIQQRMDTAEASIQSTSTRKRGREYKLAAATSQADEDAARKQRKREYTNAGNKRYRQRQRLLLQYKIMFNNHEFTASYMMLVI